MGGGCRKRKDNTSWGILHLQGVRWKEVESQHGNGKYVHLAPGKVLKIPTSHHRATDMDFSGMGASLPVRLTDGEKKEQSSFDSLRQQGRERCL